MMMRFAIVKGSHQTAWKLMSIHFSEIEILD